MNRIGFPKPKMKEEERIALLPDDIKNIEHPEFLYFQKGYGLKYEFSDDDYKQTGSNIVDEREAYNLEIMCQAKFSYEDIPYLKENQIVFGWLHLEKGDKDTVEMQNKKITAIAWEFMYKNDEYVFKKNRRITGEIGILHSVAYAGKIPSECKTAVIGKGMVGNSAKNQLEKLGAKVTIYCRDNIHLLKRYMDNYDIIVHCAAAYPKIILIEEDLGRMKQGALFVYLGDNCIRGNIERSSIYSPVVPINNGKNLAYNINHVPTLAYQTASKYISQDVAPYIDMLVRREMDETLRNAIVINKGKPFYEKLL